MIFLIFSISMLSIVFTKPLLEDWGIISWFRNAPPDFAMWTTWIKNTFNGTPARPFQIIAWVMGIQVGKLLPFTFEHNSILGIALVHGIMGILKLFIILKCIPTEYKNTTKYLICLIAIYPAVWPSIFNPQSLSSQFASVLYLLMIFLLFRYDKTVEIKYLFGLSLILLMMLMTYQGLVLSFAFTLFFLYLLNRKIKNEQSTKFFKILSTVIVSGFLYAAYLYLQFKRLGNLGYETSGAGTASMREVGISLVKTLMNIFPTLFRESPFLNLIWFLSIYYVIKHFCANNSFLKISTLFFCLSPVTSLVFFFNLEWSNDPNRVLFTTSFSISSLLLVLLHQNGKSSEANLKRKTKKSNVISSFNPKDITKIQLVFLLVQISIGIYLHGNLILKSYSDQKELIKVVKSEIDFSEKNPILIRDYSQEVGDYYFFFGAGAVLNSALSAEGITSDITFCSPTTSNEGFKVVHRQAIIRKIGNGPQTHPGSCFESRFLNGSFYKTYDLSRVNGNFVLREL